MSGAPAPREDTVSVREANAGWCARAPEFGDLIPWFSAETDGNLDYHLGVVGGRWLILLFYGSLSTPACAQAHEAVLARADLFNDTDAACFAISADRADRAAGLKNHQRGVRYFWDFDLKVFRQYGLVNDVALRPMVFIVDRGMRVSFAGPIEATAAALEALAQILKGEQSGLGDVEHAPVLILPRVFEADLCQRLIEYYRQSGGTPSGFAAEVGGKTVTIVDSVFKRRRDAIIEDQDLRTEITEKITRRIFPMIERTMHWRASEIERYLVCRYDAQDQGFFSAHRDDATAGTAHRQFACSIVLNEDYEGGSLRFPEFGRRLYRPSLGGAMVFCCSLLHEVTPVTKGERFVFVPFFYDEAGVRVRAANLARVGD